ncbi:hypothetical protein [Pectobacterium phage PcaP2EGY]
MPTKDSPFRQAIDSIPVKENLQNFTIQEMQEEINRRKESKEKEFIRMARELYDMGFSYDELDEMIGNV